MSTKKLGLLAGEGYLAKYTAQTASSQGYKVYAVTINSQASRDLQGHYTSLYQSKRGNMQGIIDFFRSNQVDGIIAIGKFKKLELMKQIPFLDSKGWEVIKQLKNFDDNTFHSLIERLSLQETNAKFWPQAMFLRDYFVPLGEFSSRKLSSVEHEDLQYGIQMASKASSLGVGQTIIVKNQAVMALEAIEGTDEAVIRGCKYAGTGAVIVKVPWLEQSNLFDLPTVGPRTIKRIAENKGICLAVKANQTFVIEMEKCIEWANKYNIAFLSF